MEFRDWSNSSIQRLSPFHQTVIPMNSSGHETNVKQTSGRLECFRTGNPEKRGCHQQKDVSSMAIWEAGQRNCQYQASRGRGHVLTSCVAVPPAMRLPLLSLVYTAGGLKTSDGDPCKFSAPILSNQYVPSIAGGVGATRPYSASSHRRFWCQKYTFKFGALCYSCLVRE